MSQTTVIWTLEHPIQGSGRRDYCYRGSKDEAVLRLLRFAQLFCCSLDFNCVILQRGRERNYAFEYIQL